MNLQRNPAVFGGIILLIFGLLAGYWGYIVIQGVFTPLLFAAVFAVVFNPIYEWLLKKTKSEILSSLLTSFILIILVAALLSFAVYLAVGEVVSITKLLSSNYDLHSINFLQDQEQFQILVDQTIASLNTLLQSIPFVDASISEIITEFLKTIPPLLQEVSTSLLGFVKIGFDSATAWIIQLITFFISFFFLLIDGKKFAAYTFRLLPINALHERQITKRFSNLCFAWIVVSLLIAFIQGALAAIGFVIIGVPSPLVWGIITMFASFIPFIGAAIIWATMGIIYIILGKFAAGIFILIWGAILISSSDNVLRPFLLKEGVKIHPLILFLAVLGGFYAFSVPGLIIGPLIMVFISTLLYIYELEFEEELETFHRPKLTRRATE